MDDQSSAHLSESSNNGNQKPSGAPAYLTYEELSRLTRISVSTLRRRVKDGSLPFFQPGGHRTRIVFPVDAVERAVDAVERAADAAGAVGGAPATAEVVATPPPKTSRHGPEPKWLREV